MEQSVFSVGQINRYIKNLLEHDFILNGLFVKGEISNFKAHSTGNFYFTLKDAAGGISCMMFRQDAKLIPFEIENGMDVIVYGNVSLYERTGQYQLYAQIIEPIGIGALQLTYEQLKAKLEIEGLFDEDFKREFPEHIKTIGVITSPTGAVIRDIIHVTKRRDPRVKIVIFPALVQGTGAVESIVKAIALANEWGQADVLIVGRGGGSIEDLWAFNEEKVARSIFASEIPVISAVGHETDVTISDFVADKRASTPSVAAEMATELMTQRATDLEWLEERLLQNIGHMIKQSQQRLDHINNQKIWKYPLEFINKKKQGIEEKQKQLDFNVNHIVQKERQKLLLLETRLQAVSPLEIMKKGYAMVLNQHEKNIVSVDTVVVGDRLNLQMQDGNLKVEVVEKVVIPRG